MRFANGDVFSGGIGREIYDACEIEKYGTGIRVEKLKRIYDNMVIESGCDFLFHTNLIDVVVENGFVKYAIVSAKSGIYAIKAKVFVDATGDGDLCAMAGNPYEMGDEDGKCMPATLCSIWVDIDWDNVQKPDSRELARAFADGVFTQEDYHLSGMWRTGEHLGETLATVTMLLQLMKGLYTGNVEKYSEFEKYYRSIWVDMQTPVLKYRARILASGNHRIVEIVWNEDWRQVLMTKLEDTIIQSIFILIRQRILMTSSCRSSTDLGISLERATEFRTGRWFP